LVCDGGAPREEENSFCRGRRRSLRFISQRSKSGFARKIGVCAQRGVQMQPIMRRTFSIFAPGVSLRRRVALSLAIVRLILAPVILAAVYYLFEMGWIVDRIVSVDAPAATLAQQASIQMLEARRAGRNFFLLYDAADVKENQESITALSGSLNQIRNLQPEEQATVENALYAVAL